MSGKRRNTTLKANDTSLDAVIATWNLCLGPEFDCFPQELLNNRDWLIKCCNQRWGVSQELLQAGYPIKKTPNKYPSEVFVSFFNFRTRWVILVEVLAKTCESKGIDSTPLLSYRIEAESQGYQKTESFKQATATLQRLRIKLQQCESPNSQEYKGNTPQHSPNPSHPTNEDGPMPPNHFWYKGIPNDLQPLLWKILNYMWDKDTAPANDVIESVWGKDDTTEPNFRTSVSRLDTAISKITKGYYSFSVKNGFLVKTVKTT